MNNIYNLLHSFLFPIWEFIFPRFSLWLIICVRTTKHQINRRSDIVSQHVFTNLYTLGFVAWCLIQQREFLSEIKRVRTESDSLIFNICALLHFHLHLKQSAQTKSHSHTASTWQIRACQCKSRWIILTLRSPLDSASYPQKKGQPFWAILQITSANTKYFYESFCKLLAFVLLIW